MSKMLRSQPIRRATVEAMEPRALLAATPAGAELRVNTFTASDQGADSPRGIAADADGDFVVTWSSTGQDGSGEGVYAQRFNAAGAPQGAEFRVNTTTARNQQFASVAMDADGDFVVVWQGEHATSVTPIGTPTHDIYARRYNAAGVAQGGEFLVNAANFDDRQFPTAAMDADGDFVVTWSNVFEDGQPTYGVYARRFNAAGTAQGAEFRVNTTTIGPQAFSTAAMDDDGDFVITWSSIFEDFAYTYGVYAQRYNAAGAPQGGEFRVNSTTEGIQGISNIDMDADGDFVVAWQSYYQDGSQYGVYARRFNATGAPKGDEFGVNATTPGQQRYATVGVDADGDFAIAWQSAGQDGSGYGIYTRQYSAAGAPRGGETRVNTFTTGIQAGAIVAMDSAGDFVVGWSSVEQDGSGYGVYAQRYAAPVAVTSSAFNFTAAAPSPHCLTFRFGADVSGTVGTADLQLQNLTTSTTIAAATMAVSYDPATQTATFTFPGQPGGVLPNGNYRATLLAAGVTTRAGGQVDGNGDGAGGDNYVLSFFQLAGDINRDRAVNGTDFSILASNFGRTGQAYAAGDLNGDGAVNGTDFSILAGSFGKTLPTAALTSPTMRVTTTRAAAAPLVTAPSPPDARRRVRRGMLDAGRHVEK